MQTIPLKSVPNQTLTIILATQLTKLRLFTTVDGKLYIDVLVNDVVLLAGVLCQNQNRIIRDSYFGFAGDFAFVDTQASNDPEFGGLGQRYQLVYLSETDIANL
jgi:hypothetical protein